ncbi:hypothetical protein DICPUDRAFT_76029 [Dictyostelium purpureum]|uniref:OTU domain-containing protein n=1 Tax=Dictyostelium purpureum TaxID=5786 RepID=F0ZCD6_DICPU|nr:uncharacterized protein DICPUDRAFT_76029 [Dictyostelium purpureum]EGC38426.1 hypothetical protein DICPUDRAFT_76029 [Dictyostelium purpureum]|eukprot:XP_003285087.1 hypothetical protein DICPUDRAFT_76029 [Dictyostelium purpureum]
MYDLLYMCTEDRWVNADGQWISEENYWASQVLQQQEQQQQIQLLQQNQHLQQEKQNQQQEQIQQLQHLQKLQQLHINQQQEQLQQLQQNHQDQLQKLQQNHQFQQQKQLNQLQQLQKNLKLQKLQQLKLNEQLQQLLSQPKQPEKPQPQQEQSQQQQQRQDTQQGQQPQNQNVPAPQISQDPKKPNDIDLTLVNSNGKLSIQPTPWIEIEKAYLRLNERIELYQLMPKNEIPGDGNCQMHALSDQIYGDLLHSKLIRFRIVCWLRRNKGFKLPNGATLSDFITTNSWEEYCNNMSKNGTWGDHLTLVAAAEVFKRSISIISSVESQSSFFIDITPKSKEDDNAILLSHFAEFHYGSLCQLVD